MIYILAKRTKPRPPIMAEASSSSFAKLEEILREHAEVVNDNFEYIIIPVNGWKQGASGFISEPGSELPVDNALINDVDDFIGGLLGDGTTCPVCEGSGWAGDGACTNCDFDHKVYNIQFDKIPRVLD